MDRQTYDAAAQASNDPKNGNQDFCFFDDPPQAGEAAEIAAADAVLRVLQVLCNARHPGLKLSADCLLALVNRSDEKSQAAIGRKHGLSRAAISKRLRDMRKGRFLGDLEMFFFGGRREDSERARIRATRVHRERKELCKTSTHQQRAAATLLSQL